MGNSGFGKSCIVNNYVYRVESKDYNDEVFNMYSENCISTIGVEFQTVKKTIDNVAIKIQIWDTAGQEQFRAITRSLFHSTDGFVVVYDITDRDSFDNVKNWMDEIKNKSNGDPNVILIGNKNDLDHDRQVSLNEGKALANSYKYRDPAQIG